MGRKAGFNHNEDTRKRIQAALIIKRLEKHVFASSPLLDASQVNAAKTLLNKVLPDLKAHEHMGDLNVKVMLKEQRDAAVKAASRADS